MIELNNLCFTYPKMSSALFDQLNLHLGAGTICGLLGPNGAGKSTLLKIMSGLIFPKSGTCKVMQQVPALRQPCFLSDIFLLPEEISVPSITATQYAKRFSPFYPRFDQDKFNELLDEFELNITQKLNCMSQGQKKKFVLAFGIATNTRLLIMDEPTNGLDIPSKSQFRRIILKHWDENRSFIISTHQVNDLDGLIDSVAIIANGNILLHESMDVIEQRYLMTKESSKPSDALYFEETLSGYAVIRQNIESEASQPDLGLLYGLVTSPNMAYQHSANSEGA